MPAVIDRLPNDQRQIIVEAFSQNQSSRSIAALLRDKLGVSLSHNAVNRYINSVLKPARETALKVHQLNTVKPQNVLRNQTLAKLTQQIATADPLVAHIEEIENDLREGRGIAKNDRDVKALAAAARTELDAIKLTAELTGRKQADGSVQVVLLADNHTEQHIHIEQGESGQATEVVDISPTPQD